MYELLADHDALPYMQSMKAMTGSAGLLPEQVWDSDALPRRGLFPGRPSGSAMPLVWAHAEFIKLAFSFATRTPCDRPAAVWRRYQGRPPTIKRVIWTLRFPISEMHVGQHVSVCLPEPALVHYGSNGWSDVADVATFDSGVGLHVVDLPSARLKAGQFIDFTLFWTTSKRWEGRNFRVQFVSADHV
jgi:glucoamylase